MRIAISVLLFLFLSSISTSAAEDPMAVQRCVWSCLANSKGADDPAYERCVKQNCEAEKSATKHKKSKNKQ